MYFSSNIRWNMNYSLWPLQLEKCLFIKNLKFNSSKIAMRDTIFWKCIYLSRKNILVWTFSRKHGQYKNILLLTPPIIIVELSTSLNSLVFVHLFWVFFVQGIHIYNFYVFLLSWNLIIVKCHFLFCNKYCLIVYFVLY